MLNLKKIFLQTIAIAGILSLAACCTPTVERAYKKLLKPCVKNDLTGNLLYFGPANNLSPGAVLKAQNDGGYGLAFRLPRLVTKATERAAMLDVSNSGICEGVAKLNKKLAGKIATQEYVGQVDLAAQLDQSEAMSVTVEDFKWITLEQTPFETKIDQLADDSPMRRVLLKENSYVMTRALLIKGMAIEYVFSQSVGSSVKGAYEAGNLSADLKGEWTGDTKFTLTVTEPFYVAGELRPYNEEGLSTLSQRFGNAVEIDKNARVDISTELLEEE